MLMTLPVGRALDPAVTTPAPATPGEGPPAAQWAVWDDAAPAPAPGAGAAGAETTPAGKDGGAVDPPRPAAADLAAAQAPHPTPGPSSPLKRPANDEAPATETPVVPEAPAASPSALTSSPPLPLGGAERGDGAGGDDEPPEKRSLELRLSALFAFLHECDVGDRTPLLESLDHLPPSELSDRAVQLEQRALRLSFHEAHELKRVRRLNILAGPTTPPAERSAGAAERAKEEAEELEAEELGAEDQRTPAAAAAAETLSPAAAAALEEAA